MDKKFSMLFKLLALIIMVGAQAASATTYYVAMTGSDSNLGTESQPFKTIQKAADIVNPGDAVIVDDGIYTNSNQSCIVCIWNRGGSSPTSMVTFKSKNKWGAVIDGQNLERTAGFSIFSVGYIRIEGFEIKNIRKVANGGGSGIEVFEGANYEFVGNHIHHIGNVCTSSINGEVGIYLYKANKVLIDGNNMHDIGRFENGEQGCTNTNNNYKNHDHGIYHDLGDDVTISNNIFYNFKRGWAIQAYPGARARMKILNNTFAFPNPYNVGHIIIYYTSATDSLIENNIFYQPKTAALHLEGATGTNNKIGNNIVYGGVISNFTPAGYLFSNNRENTDPLMVAPASLNFHLQSTSPAINTGLYESIVTKDFDGNLRPSGGAYDIGAYEYVSASAPTLPAAPTALTATAVSSSQINLAFADNSSNETGFELERSSGGSAYVKIATLGVNVKTYSDVGRAASTAYTYRVRAVNGAGASAYSNPASATTLAATPTAPLAPSNLVASAASSSQINLSFTDNSSDETGFEVERSSGGGAYVKIATLGSNVRTYSDSGLAASTAYSYRVRAIKLAGASSYSNLASATTLAATTPGVNLILNPGFESGTANWWDGGNTSIVSGSVNSGLYSLRVTGEGGRGQAISGMKASTAYVLSVAGRRNTGGTEVCDVAMEYRNSSGQTVRLTGMYITGTSWATRSVTFTMPSSFSNVQVFVWKDPGAGYCWVDDFKLIQK
jgi:hypothetical protein